MWVGVPAGDAVPVIEVDGLTKRYGAATAVDKVSFVVAPGRVTGFLGPNGAGKSTTLRLVFALEAATSGRATVNGRPYGDLKRGLHHAGVLLDAARVHGARSGYAHLAALAASNGIATRRVRELLVEVGLEQAGHRRISGYSLGMRQRLGIAAALLGDPPVVVCDEPFNGLDPAGVQWARKLLRRLAAQGRTVLVSSHLMAEMQIAADHLLVIDRGRLLADEPVNVFAAGRRGPSVDVGGTDMPRLAAVLVAAGAVVVPRGVCGLSVRGLSAAEIGELALDHRIALHELVARTPTLEDAFMSLTQPNRNPATESSAR